MSILDIPPENDSNVLILVPIGLNFTEYPYLNLLYTVFVLAQSFFKRPHP